MVDPVAIAPGLGDVQLVRALVVRIAMLLAGGRRTDFCGRDF
jgi:hypothetical protein